MFVVCGSVLCERARRCAAIARFTHVFVCANIAQTFTKWANNHMVKSWGSACALTNLEHDFDTGERLMQLVNSLYGIPMPAK
jgi:hypothetical protein